MSKNLVVNTFFFFCAIFSWQCSPDRSESQVVRDIDGNAYKTVTIGKQTWMAENLRVTKYRDATAIPLVTDGTAWKELTKGAYCDYDNDPAKAALYGHLYNFFAVVDSRKISPQGWHVPSDAEWQRVIDYLGGEKIAGGKLKETSGDHWLKNVGAANTSGFTGMPGGCRDVNIGSDKLFDWIGLRGWFWSSTEWGEGFSWSRDLNGLNASVHREHPNNRNGFSVRCVKD